MYIGDDFDCDPTSIYWPKNAEEMQLDGMGCPR